MTPEQKFKDSFCAVANTIGTVARIETSTLAGVFDLNILSSGKEVWVELKVESHKRYLLRPEQYAWGHRRADHGGRCFVVALGSDDMIRIWKFPEIGIERYSKYLSITTMAETVVPKHFMISAVNFLFTP